MSKIVEPDPLGPNFADPIVSEAHKRAQRCLEWRANADENWLSDYKFRHGDDINNYQWPNAIRRARDTDAKPCLTMNVVRQHNLMIVNEGSQGKTAMKVRPVGNGATAESSQMLTGLLRHIEYQSRAQLAYTQARQFQVDCGRGWLRLYSDYDSPDSFDQDLFIGGCNDPLSIHLDPDIKEKDGSDAKFGFVFDKVLKTEFNEAYPKFKNKVGDLPMGIGRSNWNSKDYLRICEYFRIVSKPDELWSVESPDGSGRKSLIRKSKVPEEMHETILAHPGTKRRDVWDDVCEWYLIAGDKKVDHTIWLGKTVPLIPVLGEETVIDGLYDCKGHTRAMRDAQRMYNYSSSSQVEFVAQQGKTPWIAPVAAIEELEQYWNTANITNHSVLPWNHVDDEGNPIPAPVRADPPKHSEAYEVGMTTAFNQMMMTSGQWQNQMGMGGNERTGDAISRRQEQSDTAVYHFFDNFSTALDALCRQCIDVFPHIYDTKRVLHIQDDNGVSQEVELDPTARQSYLQTIAHNGEVVKRLFNPLLGKYDIQAGSGPDYGTARTETVKAMSILLTQNKELVPVIGDLLLASMDFDKAQEAAQRMKRMVPSQALGTGPSQSEQMLHAQVVSLQGALAKALTDNAKDKLKLVGKAELRDIEAYDSETKRMAALQKLLGGDQQGLDAMIQQLVQDALTTHITGIQQVNQGELESQATAVPQSGNAFGASVPVPPPQLPAPQGNLQ